MRDILLIIFLPILLGALVVGVVLSFCWLVSNFATFFGVLAVLFALWVLGAVVAAMFDL